MYTQYISKEHFGKESDSDNSNSSESHHTAATTTVNEGADEDDMIFFVRKTSSTTSSRTKKSKSDQYFVRRRTAGNVPTWQSDKTVDWERSYLLNYITQVKTYEMTVMVCHNDEENPQKPFRTVRRVVKPVYGSPHKVNITDANDKSATVQEVGFPYIYFTVIDFDDAFREIAVPGPGFFIAVRLTARVTLFGVDLGVVSLFSGGLTYTAFAKSYADQGSWWWLGDTLGKKLPGLLAPVLPGKMRPSQQRFAEIRGPGGKGFVKFGLEPAASPDNNNNNNNNNNENDSNKGQNKEGTKGTGLRCMPTYLSLSYDSIATTLFKKGSLKISQQLHK